MVGSTIVPRIAVIGSGPSGLYVCKRILQRLKSCHIDVFDKNQAPYGLVTYGVAPDHHDMKKCSDGFERMFFDNKSRLSLFCNVAIGSDLTYSEVCNLYEVVVLAYGASKPRKLGMKNETAINCFSGSDFVSWYNGQKLYSENVPLLDCPDVTIIGNGNVAIDCARILLSSAEKLSHTDITENAIRILKSTKVENVRILGRRGPKEASFTIKELRELLNMDCKTHCDIPEDIVNEISRGITKEERPKRRILELMLNNTRPSKVHSDKRLTLEFFSKPLKIGIDKFGRVSCVELQNSITNETKNTPCQLLIYAIGFENYILDELPKTSDNKLLMDDWCRVPSTESSVYATGWCSHVARGLIAESQTQAFAVADQIIEDLEAGKVNLKDAKGSMELLDRRNVPYIDWNMWSYIDDCERRMGAVLGKPREKIIFLPSFFRMNK